MPDTETLTLDRATDPRPLVIYHGGCPDGFTAAWIARLRWPLAEFHAGVYGAPFPNVDGRDVVIVDFSYPLDQTLELMDRCRSLLMLDHHETAVQNLAPLGEGTERHRIILDQTHSGAMLAWLHIVAALQEEPSDAPMFVRYVEDRDLWKFDLLYSREVNAYIQAIPFNFEKYDALAQVRIDRLVELGAAIEMRNRTLVDQIVETQTRMMRIGGYEIPVVAAPYGLGSDAAARLSPGRPFAGYYTDHADKRSFGLRSEDDGLDVSEIAGMYGGGGHVHAAGFRVPRDHPLATC